VFLELSTLQKVIAIHSYTSLDRMSSTVMLPLPNGESFNYTASSNIVNSADPSYDDKDIKYCSGKTCAAENIIATTTSLNTDSLEQLAYLKAEKSQILSRVRNVMKMRNNMKQNALTSVVKMSGSVLSQVLNDKYLHVKPQNQLRSLLVWCWQEDQKFIDEFRERAVQLGLSPEQARVAVGLNRATFYNWMNQTLCLDIRNEVDKLIKTWIFETPKDSSVIRES
jgi:hypothetical protein